MHESMERHARYEIDPEPPLDVAPCDVAGVFDHLAVWRQLARSEVDEEVDHEAHIGQDVAHEQPLCKRCVLRAISRDLVDEADLERYQSRDVQHKQHDDPVPQFLHAPLRAHVGVPLEAREGRDHAGAVRVFRRPSFVLDVRTTARLPDVETGVARGLGNQIEGRAARASESAALPTALPLWSTATRAASNVADIVEPVVVALVEILTGARPKVDVRCV